MEKWAPDHVKEQIIEKKEKNREDFKNRVEVQQAKKDKMRVDANNRKNDRKRKNEKSNQAYSIDPCTITLHADQIQYAES